MQVKFLKKSFAIIIACLLLAVTACLKESGEQKAKPTPSFIDVSAIEKVEAAEPIWLEVEDAVLFRANLCRPDVENLFGLYYGVNEGFADFSVDFAYKDIRPFVEPRSMVLIDLDGEDEYQEIVLCVVATADTDYTYVLRYDGSQIVTLYEGEGTFIDLQGRTLTLSTGEVEVPLEG